MNSPSEHAYSPTSALLVLPLLALIALPITFAVRPPAAPWGPLQYLIVALLSGLPALGMYLLFTQTVYVGPDGVERRGPLGRRFLAWKDIHSLRFQRGIGRVAHRAQTDKLVLIGDRGRIMVTSAFTNYQALRERMDAELARVDGPSITNAEASYERRGGSMPDVPHREDLPELFIVPVVLMMVSVGMIAWLLDSSAFAAL